MGFPPRYDHVNAGTDIQKLQRAASEAVNNGGEVLFVTERQLLTFKELNNIPLVPEYEQIELMEMAMSGTVSIWNIIMQILRIIVLPSSLPRNKNLHSRKRVLL